MDVVVIETSNEANAASEGTTTVDIGAATSADDNDVVVTISDIDYSDDAAIILRVDHAPFSFDEVTPECANNAEAPATSETADDEHIAQCLQMMETELDDHDRIVIEGEENVEHEPDISVEPPAEDESTDAQSTSSDTLAEILAALGDVEDPEMFLQMQNDILRNFNLAGDESDELEDDDARFWLNLMRTLSVRSREQQVVRRPTEECQVCLLTVELGRRACCSLAVCDDCLQTYVETQLVDAGNVRIACPNHDCKSPMFQEEIRQVLRTNQELRERYDRWLVDMNGDAHRKTCPRCCNIMEIEPTRLKDRQVSKWGLQVECPECHLEWCFPCQAPWHEGVKCKKFRTGDVLLKNWVIQYQNGQRNAQRCPKCKVYVQRNEGCDHMTCRCGTEFCYRCGGRRLPSFKLFGILLEDHDLRHSIIGCNSMLCKGRPVQRVLARGAIFGAKVLAGIVALPLLIGVGGAVVAVGAAVAAVAAPAYGTYKLVRHVRRSVNPDKYS